MEGLLVGADGVLRERLDPEVRGLLTAERQRLATVRASRSTRDHRTDMYAQPSARRPPARFPRFPWTGPPPSVTSSG